jgi:hypothetical protein
MSELSVRLGLTAIPIDWDLMVAPLSGVLMAATTGYPACNTVLQGKTARLDPPEESHACIVLMAIVSRETTLERKSLRTRIYMSPMDANALDGGWRKASRSVNNGACVEVASGTSTVMVRDSVDPSGPVVSYSARTWQRFVATAKTDILDISR